MALGVGLIWPVCVLCLSLIKHINGQYQDHVFCGDIIVDSIDSGSHIYQFNLNHTENVNFDLCQSVADVTIFIFNVNYDEVSNQYCSGGDYCGSCHNGGNYAENFTIPMMQSGQYYIGIAPYDVGGQYNLIINCISTNGVIKQNNSYPNSTIMYTTSASSDKCKYWLNEEYSVLPSQQIVSAIIITDSMIEISFDIKLTEYCNTSICNILYIGTPSIKLPSISINADGKYFEISVTDEYKFNYVYTIANADVILPVDNKYHHIYLIFASNKQIFKVDDVTHYASYSSHYGDYVSLLNQEYILYASSPWSKNVDATLRNVCIYPTVSDDSASNTINCGDDLNGEIFSSQDVEYYYFTLLEQYYPVLFDSCNSSYDTVLSLYDITFNFLDEADDDGSCGNRAQLLINSLDTGDYILGIGGVSYDTPHYGKWRVKMICVYNDTNSTHRNYKLIQGWNQHWNDAEVACQSIFSTNLATITTEADMIAVLEIINKNWIAHEGVWIGMHLDVVNNGNWKWSDDTSCSYTATGNCIDDIHWHVGQPEYNDSVNSQSAQIGAYLYVGSDASSAVMYDTHFDGNLSYFMCNAPNRSDSEYCLDINGCWRSTVCCNDSALRLDIKPKSSSDYFRPPIAYWNETLFVVGLEAIHYTKFDLFASEYAWHYTIYNDLDTKWLTYMSSQRYAQFESSLYLYVPNVEYTELTLIHFDLNTLKSTPYVTPQDTSDLIWTRNYLDDRCIVADESHVYIVGESTILIYYTNLNEWSVSDRISNLNTAACAITNDYKSIYIFSYDSFVIRYNVMDGNITILDSKSPNLCWLLFAKAVTAKNGKMYLSGCYISWQTAIFDPKIEQFEAQTIDINHPIDTGSYYNSHMTSFDDNVLLLFSVINTINTLLYFTVTDLISINFVDTTSTVWPSDGFLIK
eukprot:547915_1